MKEDKKNMLVVLEEYQLKTPNREQKMITASLRKEIRNYVEEYIGNFTREVKVIRDLKKEEFVKNNINSYKKQFKPLQKEVDEINSQLKKSVDMVNEMKERKLPIDTDKAPWDFFDERKEIYVEISKRDMDKYLLTYFDENYAQQFNEFSEMLETFKKKVEESLLFGTITDIYTLIKNYDEIKPFVNKLSRMSVPKYKKMKEE